MSGCAKKTRFRDEVAAKLALARMDTERTSKLPIRAYRCSLCGSWHLTSQRRRSAS